MKDCRDYEKAFEIIGRIIRAWDPYCLIAEGAPPDEFDGEIAKITAKVVGFRSAADAAQAISDVFLASFGPEERFSAIDCYGPGDQIFLELSRAKLVSAV